MTVVHRNVPDSEASLQPSPAPRASVSKPDDDAFIQPCPFSRGYRIPKDSAWRSLLIYQGYRLTLACILLGILFATTKQVDLGKIYPALSQPVAIVYFALVLISGVLVLLRRPNYALQAQMAIFIDIAALTLLTHASGGIHGGLGMLLAVTMAAGGLLIGGRCALVFAAIGSIAMLGDQLVLHINTAFNSQGYTYAGAQGAAYFAIAVLAFVAAKRTEQSDTLARQRGADITNLQQLNEYIVQHLQSGILVINENDQHILTTNKAALQLFDLNAGAASLETVSPELHEKYRHWLRTPHNDHASLDGIAGNRIQVRFSRFAAPSRDYDMIFLEDDALHRQRVQRSKLASLGRLTASIAHEIRNPLSAIKHAAQLLAESPQIPAQDQRLIQIMIDNAGRVNQVVENILQLSRRSDSQQNTLNLRHWLKQFLADFVRAQVLESNPFDCQCDNAGSRVIADPQQLRQILDNLCINALKYGHPERGKIILRACRSGPDSKPCIEVIDHGDGIDAKLTDQIFEPFYTSSSTGTGLGLYIARELAELNQARLSYQRAPEGGSCFRLCLRDAEDATVEL